MEITEDKAIQNLYGRGKIIMKYNIDKEKTKVFLKLSNKDGEKSPEYFVNKTENGFEIEISVNEVGNSSLAFYLNNSYSGEIYFKCDKCPDEYLIFPTMYDSYINSDANLIRPIQYILQKGQYYTFEIKTNDFQELYIAIYQETTNRIKIKMKRQGDTLIAENIFIHKYYNDIYIISINNNNEEKLLDFTI